MSIFKTEHNYEHGDKILSQVFGTTTNLEIVRSLEQIIFSCLKFSHQILSYRSPELIPGTRIIPDMSSWARLCKHTMIYG